MINYPTKNLNNTNQKTSISSSNRGMNLEDDLNQTNLYYRDQNKAIIYKKPTPITIVKVDYPSRNKAKITEAYYKVASTTDYNGINRGRYIDFEAKETHSKTSFALSNLHQHQIDHMNSIQIHGGIAFIILRFSALDETYLLFIQDLSEFIKLHSRKSLPYEFVSTKGFLIKYHLLKPVDYLSILDQTQLKELKHV